MKKFLIIIFSLIILLTGCEKNNESKDIVTKNNENLVGVWINYNEINALVSQCNSEEELNNKINEMLLEFEKFKINTIFLHCRAFDDCFYDSTNYLPSKYCLNKNGELKFDILKCFIEASNDFNIEIHAWINPYRIRKDGNTEQINLNSLAGTWYYKNPTDQRLVITENSIFYNPASIEVQKYILNGIKEILENYSVSGIHIDDYFYPTTNQSIDNNYYKDYVETGGTLSLDDYRRQNVNSLVSSIYSLVKSYNKDLIFSISPSADITADYNAHYADVELWSSVKGYVDFLIPQIYFGFEHETMSFNKLISKWSNLKSEYVKIAVGLSVYKSGEIDNYAKSGSFEWVDNSDIISRQISVINNESLDGYVFYSSSYLLNDYNENLIQEKYNIVS